MFDHMGRLLIGFGILLALIGAGMVLVGKLGIGKLPGDIVYQRGNFTFYFPIVSCILLSIALTAIFWLLGRR